MLPGGVCFGKAGNVDLKIAEVAAVVVIILLTGSVRKAFDILIEYA